MHIDRTKFLALTAALATSCAQRTQPPQEQPATVVDSEALVHLDSPPPANPIFPDEHAAHGDRTDTEADPTRQDAPLHEGSPGRVSGLATACSQLQAPPGPHCESFDTLQGDCETVVGLLEPTVAQHTMQCLLARSGTRKICDMLATNTCAERSISHAPLRASASAPCRTVVRNCGGKLSQARCESFLSAIVPPRDAVLVTCLSEDCQLSPCFWAL